MKTIAYHYENAPIPGGGYVTGFAFHEKEEGILYARTDIGGVYRYLYKEKRWKSLADHVTMEDLSETFPAAIALDETHPERLYIACGEDRKATGVLASSEDYGETFSYTVIPTPVHGNLNGRGTGNRLVVDRSNPDVLYFASQKGGLYRSKDRGCSFEKLYVGGEEYMTFVYVSKDGRMVVVGTAGVTTRETKNRRGKSLYVSYDAGETFSFLSQPVMQEGQEAGMSGFVAQRYAEDDRYLYITLSCTGAYSYVKELGYSCDSGDAQNGRVLRYAFCADGTLGEYEDITPGLAEDGVTTVVKEAGETRAYEFGFSGISAGEGGFLTCTTICKPDGDLVLTSNDYGKTWRTVLYDLSVGRLEFRTSYMKPQYNGGHSLLHWLSDIKINPFCPGEAWFNTGTGVFRTDNLNAEEVAFYDCCDGIEETVHLNVYAPPAGEVQLLDIVGDLGGFAFRNLMEPCDTSFSDAEGNRYITCINADYSDLDPNKVIVTPRGNWKGKTKGGLILSLDQCKTFRRLPMPFGLSERLDKTLHEMERPNVNSGWAAMSSDGKNLVWSVADGIHLPMEQVIYSNDGGEHFAVCEIYNLAGKRIFDKTMKVFSDRIQPQLFYGFGSASDFYVSRDGGRRFVQSALPAEFPVVDFSLIDCANKTEVRAEAGRTGIFYMALAAHGLWKLVYDSKTGALTVKRLTPQGTPVYRVGLGLLRQGGSYFAEPKALYICGTIEKEYGFYRSFDEAKTWERINTKAQMFGEINSIAADARAFGRFYLATGSRGVLYGEPCEQ